MTRIGVRELRQHASHYLEKVKDGEVVEITDRGKLVALLVSPTPAVAIRETHCNWSSRASEGSV